MANKSLGTAPIVGNMLRSNSVLVEVGGSVRRIKLDDLMNSINQGDEQLLRQVAWGVPLKQSVQSSPAWGRVGNITMWEEYKRNSGRYLVTNGGEAAKLSPTNSGIFADGTTLNETKGHVMEITPRLYYLVKSDAVSGIPYLWMSQMPIGGNYIEETCMGAYIGSMAGSALTSRSGLAPAGGKQITAFWEAAQVNGKSWGLTDYDHVRKMMMFALSEYGNANIQAMLGNGVCGNTNKDLWAVAAKLTTGATKSLGDGFGKIPISVVNGSNTGVDCSRVNLLGVEDWYGWLYQMIQGIYFGNDGNSAQNGREVFIYEGNRMPSSAELTTHPSGKYRQLTRLTTSGYVSEMALGGYFDLIATELGGGSNDHWCDYFYGNTTGQLCLWGGHANNGAFCGCACAHSHNAFSYSNANVGARLAYYGKITFVDGKEIK